MKPIRILTILCLLLVAATSAFGDGPGDAAVFWSLFRKAVISNDVERVITLTQFPFELHIPAVWIPNRHVDRRAFPETLSKVLSQKLVIGTEDYAVEKKMLQVVRDKVKLTGQDFVTDSYIRVEAFEFEFVNGRWYFTGAYLVK